MSKGKDFFGKDISEVIELACKELGVSREELDIQVMETGSAGIFGLCKKKAHIRVYRKATHREKDAPDTLPVVDESLASEALQEVDRPAEVNHVVKAEKVLVNVAKGDTIHEEGVDDEDESEDLEPDSALEPPSEENLVAIRDDLQQLLQIMGLPAEVDVSYTHNTVHCRVAGAHESQVIGPEGRTLDSIQYLLRKMVARHLPDRVMLAMDAGNFRQKRAEELRERALELAELVKRDGKTQAIPALNPSERRVIHMVLQEEKGVRSRSVGEGLFKKVLIYKPGKGRRPAAKKRRGGQGGRSSGD
ncbi:Jag family protein [Desulfobulbus alkaliphilus]|uniref:Jag family protein n=1 Tax=Desulfobulbus alkaliphilus TaxID=869814 RepID=UPI001963CF8C|nr:Jag N-terminal domain-containing protein [Desulfobulbus alkaliphilus]MBM9537228.1 Jag N-terminal domain-containing protein [Desulfobulbus alkaliphilus]